MNKLVEWTDALSVGIDEIDAQHRVLVGLVNEMHDAVLHGQDTVAVQGILNRLTEYTRIHFAVEESLMRMLGFPGFEEHRDEHRQLIRQVNDLRRRVAEGAQSVGSEVLEFLRRWLTGHIMDSDQQYARFFVETGAGTRYKRRSWTSRLWDHLHR